MTGRVCTVVGGWVLSFRTPLDIINPGTLLMAFAAVLLVSAAKDAKDRL